MATIKPFKAIRPTKAMASMVAALPYDVMNSNEARELVENNEFSFLHVDKAEIDLDKDIYIYDDKVYAKAAENLQGMLTNGILQQDNKPLLYLYRLTMKGRSKTGIVACVSVDEYLNSTIKKHELTREDKELDRIKHIEVTNANTGPIFLAYKSKAEINTVVDNWINKHQAQYDFVMDNNFISNVRHEVFIIDDDGIIDSLIKLFSEIPSLYIADGHHRNAAAAKVALKMREQNSYYDKDSEFNYYLSVIFPDDQLEILDYNRAVRNLSGLSEDQFIKRVAQKFIVEPSDVLVKPYKKHTFGMYLNKKWYLLTANPNFIDETDPIKSLDVSILQQDLLSPILNIGDPRTDKNIEFIGGMRQIKALEKIVDVGDCAVAFSMYPTSMHELFSVADAGLLMPPKSTWFEPKLLSGLFIHSLT